MKRTPSDFKQTMNWLAVASFLVLLASCSSKTENAVAGKWREVDGTETLHFLKDGTVNIEDRGMSMEGSYEFTEENKMRLDVDLLNLMTGGPVLTEVSIADNQLTMTMPDGVVSRYERVE